MYASVPFRHKSGHVSVVTLCLPTRLLAIVTFEQKVVFVLARHFVHPNRRPSVGLIKRVYCAETEMNGEFDNCRMDLLEWKGSHIDNWEILRK